MAYGKDIQSNYGAMVSLTEELPIGTKIMEDLMKKNDCNLTWPYNLIEYFCINKDNKDSGNGLQYRPGLR